jgi:hypothetical protein
MDKYRLVSAEELRAQHSAYADAGTRVDPAAADATPSGLTGPQWRVQGCCAAFGGGDGLFLVQYAPPSATPAAEASRVEGLATAGAQLWLTKDELAALLPPAELGMPTRTHLQTRRSPCQICALIPSTCLSYGVLKSHRCHTTFFQWPLLTPPAVCLHVVH